MATTRLTETADDDLVADAAAMSLWAARRAELRVAELADVDDLAAVTELFRSIWGSTEETGPPINRDLLRAFAQAGNYVAGAFDSSGLRGALVGFLGDNDAGCHLHSHILAVRPSDPGRGTGFALKLHQRAWALARGLDTVEWTFDPLVARNAFFNITKLGAGLHHYHVDFYGRMTDDQNGGDASDRLSVRWSLRSERVATAAAGTTRHRTVARRDGLTAHLALAATPAGGPMLDAPPADAAIILLQLPEDIIALRRSSPEVARLWRLALREALTTALAAGYECDRVTRAGEYVLTRSGSQ